jgi:hypothetical protein
VKKGASLDEIIYSSISGTDITLMIEGDCVEAWAGDRSQLDFKMSPRGGLGIPGENLKKGSRSRHSHRDRSALVDEAGAEPRVLFRTRSRYLEGPGGP